MQITLTLDTNDQVDLISAQTLLMSLERNLLEARGEETPIGKRIRETVEEAAKKVAEEPVTEGDTPKSQASEPTPDKQSASLAAVRALIAKAKRAFSADVVSESLTTAGLPTKLDSMTTEDCHAALAVLEELLASKPKSKAAPKAQPERTKPKVEETVTAEEDDDVPF